MPINQNSISGNYSPLRRASINVGFTCTNDCLFCVAADKRNYPDKSTEDIYSELKSAFIGGARDVVFSGGECTIRRDLAELVSYARKLGFVAVNIQTNGRAFASEDFCKKMFIAGVTAVNPALHGHTAALHDGLTRRKGSFRQTVLGINNIRKYSRGRVPVLVNTVIVKRNYKHLPDIAKLLIGLRVHQFQFAFVHAMGNALRFFEKVVPRKTEAMPYIKKAIHIGAKAGIRVCVEAVPLCLMQGYEQHVSEFYIPSIQLWDRGTCIPRFEDVRIKYGKKKFAKCRMCSRFDDCEGPWREYPEYYGDSEFQPIVSKQ